MSQFFGRQESNNQNLQYDDIAFYYFITTACSVVFLVISCLIISQKPAKDKRPFLALEKTGLFRNQLKNQKQTKNSYFLSKSFFLKFIALIGLFGLILHFGEKGADPSNKMIGFDPHQILGVPQDASRSAIKKAFRMLSLKYHPDKNPHNPKAEAFFIIVTKAYDCLTDQKARENCEKYGNPDGQTSFKVGLGLPSFIIDPSNRTYVLPAVFVLLLLIIPYLFIRWLGNTKSIDQVGLQYANYEFLWTLFQSQLSFSKILVMFASLRQLNDYQKKIDKSKTNKLRSQIAQYKIIPLELLQKVPPQSLETLKAVIQCIINKKTDLKIAKAFEHEFKKLLFFAHKYFKRNNHRKPLMEDEKMTMIWHEATAIQYFIQFSRVFYNQIYGKQLSSVLQLLDLTPEQIQIVKQDSISNIVTEILQNPQKLQYFLRRFPPNNKHHIQRQLKNIPILKLNMQILVQEVPNNKFTTSQRSVFSYRVTKINETTGYCILKNFPFLKQQKFYLVITNESDLVHFQEIQFQENKKSYIGSFFISHNQPGKYIYLARILSDCYYGIDKVDQIQFQVVRPHSIEIQIHEQDQKIQKMQKDFIQKYLFIQSDKEFSDSEDQQGGTILNVPFRQQERTMQQEQQLLQEEQDHHIHDENCEHYQNQEQDENQQHQGGVHNHQNCQHNH